MLAIEESSSPERFGDVIHYEAGRQVPLDVALAQARRLRNREIDRLLRAACKHAATTLLSVFAPMSGCNRRAFGKHAAYDRQASLNTFIRALRADAATQDRWLGA